MTATRSVYVANTNDALAFQLKAAGIRFVREYHAIPKVRGADGKLLENGWRLRWDFYIEDANMLVEIQGGTWVAGLGHSSGTGIQRDCDKDNLADVYGYRRRHFTTQDVKSGKACRMIEDAVMEAT